MEFELNKMFKIKCMVVLIICLSLPLEVFAYQAPINLGYNSCYTGYKFKDGGSAYSDVTLPFITGKSTNLYEEDPFVPVSKISGRRKFKKGQSKRINYWGLVEVGNAGIMEAAKNGNITKIYYVEVRREKMSLSFGNIFLPAWILPVYFNKFITTVYGE